MAHEPGQVRAVLDAAHARSLDGAWCVGYVRYEAAAAFDPAFELYPADGPLAWFAVHDQAMPWPDEAPSQIVEYAPMSWQGSIDREGFDQRLASIHEAIADGETYQVNLTAPVASAFHGEPLALFRALHAAQPSSYAAYIDTGGEHVLSVSPELFFDWRDGGELLSRPMKGTAARGATPAEDERNAAVLSASEKERAENLIIVDLIRNDMSRIATPHSVRVPALFQTQAWPTVWQMTSDVRSRTRQNATLGDIFAAMFPCGSITGAPKVRAMHWIRRLEDGPRGVYCGAVGVLRPGGAATFNVAIRTVMVRGRSEAVCGIGSGITSGATADDEWVEWRNKRAFLERTAQPFELLETLRLENGRYPELTAHLDRAAIAAAHFGFRWDEAEARAALAAIANAPGTELRRVRLIADRHGKVSVQAAPMPLSVGAPQSVRVAVAAKAMELSSSEFVRFKTTRRDHYDIFAPVDEGVFDTLLWNPRGEITEFTRGNVAILIDDQWVTPPLSCGLLGGVGRARRIAEGSLTERAVTLNELHRVQGMAFFNALRGWLPAVIAK